MCARVCMYVCACLWWGHPRTPGCGTGAVLAHGPRGTGNGSKAPWRTLAQSSKLPTGHLSLPALTHPLLKPNLLASPPGKIKTACMYHEK